MYPEYHMVHMHDELTTVLQLWRCAPRFGLHTPFLHMLKILSPESVSSDAFTTMVLLIFINKALGFYWVLKMHDLIIDCFWGLLVIL